MFFCIVCLELCERKNTPGLNCWTWVTWRNKEESPEFYITISLPPCDPLFWKIVLNDFPNWVGWKIGVDFAERGAFWQWFHVNLDVVVLNLMSLTYLSLLGIFFVLPCIESYQKVDLRTITLGVPPQEVRKLHTLAMAATDFLSVSCPSSAIPNAYSTWPQSGLALISWWPQSLFQGPWNYFPLESSLRIVLSAFRPWFYWLYLAIICSPVLQASESKMDRPLIKAYCKVSGANRLHPSLHTSNTRRRSIGARPTL